MGSPLPAQPGCTGPFCAGPVQVLRVQLRHTGAQPVVQGRLCASHSFKVRKVKVVSEPVRLAIAKDQFDSVLHCNIMFLFAGMENWEEEG